MEFDEDGIGLGPEVDLAEATTQQDEPEEELDVKTNANQRAWLVKVPEFLMERWTSAPAQGQEIGRVRVYEAEAGKPQAVTVIVPSSISTNHANPIPEEYDLSIHNTQSENLFVFAEKKGVGKKRVREPALVGKVVHECNLAPDVEAPAYRDIMRKRRLKAAQPKRQVKMLTGDQATQNMMASGVASTLAQSKFSGFIKAKPKAKGDRLVRLPASEVRDMIFAAFEEFDYYSLKTLKARTQQPETYLRDLLEDIAQLNTRGPYSGHYSLLASYKRKREEAEREMEADAVKAEGGMSE